METIGQRITELAGWTMLYDRDGWEIKGTGIHDEVILVSMQIENDLKLGQKLTKRAT